MQENPSSDESGWQDVAGVRWPVGGSASGLNCKSPGEITVSSNDPDESDLELWLLGTLFSEVYQVSGGERYWPTLLLTSLVGCAPNMDENALS